jgi:hypothetical protein
MAKTYPIHDVTGNQVLNPAWPENSRPVNWINKIVVHHDAINRPHEYDDIPRYEMEAGYQNHTSIPGSRGLQYHYRISNLGDIYLVRPHGTFLWHCGDYPVNQHSLAICLDGNFELQAPTQEQFEALKQLLDELSTQHPEFPAAQGDVYPHRAFYATACPGTNLVDWVNAYRTSHGQIAVPQVGYDWPSLQPGYEPPVQPSTPTPVAVSPDTVAVPVTPGEGGVPTGQPSGDVPVTVIQPDGTPVISQPDQPEWITSYVPKDQDLTLETNAIAVDMESGEHKEFDKGTKMALAGTFKNAGVLYYRGRTSAEQGKWYGIDAESFSVLSDTTEDNWLLKDVEQAAERVIRFNPFAWGVRLLGRLPLISKLFINKDK